VSIEQPTLRAEPALSDSERVAFVDAAAFYDLTINAKDRVTEGALETAERVVIAHTGRRVDFGCGAARDGRDDTEGVPCQSRSSTRSNPSLPRRVRP